MTYKEAIEILQEEHDYCQEPFYVIAALQMAIKALEKQIPKKPIGDRYPWVICPNCGGSIHLGKIQKHIYNEEALHCEYCGQALDWSDTE